MRLIATTLLALLFCHCKTGKTDIPVNTTEDITQNLAPREQQYTIEPAKDNFLRGDKGTQLFIPAGALIADDGSLVTGDIALTLREYYSSGELFSKGLSSMSDSLLLQTGGMVFLEATAAGKRLKVDPSKSIAIAFPKNYEPDSMEVFYGIENNGVVNWKPGLPQQPTLEVPDSVFVNDSTLYTRRVDVCGWLAGLEDVGLSWQLQHPDSNIWNYVSRNLRLPSDVIDELSSSQMWTEYITLSFSNSGKVIKVSFGQGHWGESEKPSRLSDNTRRLLEAFFLNLPPFQMKSMGNTGIAHLQLCTVLAFDRKKYNERFREKYNRFRKKAVETMDLREAEYYILSATQLGWINCDRFYDFNGEKTDFIVELPSVINPRVQLQFPSINAIVQAEIVDGRAVFRNVPVGMQVIITAIAAGDKDQPLLARTNAVTSKRPFTLAGFQRFTMKELYAALNVK